MACFKPLTDNKPFKNSILLGANSRGAIVRLNSLGPADMDGIRARTYWLNLSARVVPVPNARTAFKKIPEEKVTAGSPVSTYVLSFSLTVFFILRIDLSSSGI
ncbi:hypothetical protein [Phaffia rhodozyma]|uniref:Uncharacterized protein n=1 Tax=Phaffia rhodozyma TaxID=264483 RepID=A0A0F7SKW8_PHARH|nr:hypothetical protein [Phaffia rhodozyma]